jgi:hypothetical protein
MLVARQARLVMNFSSRYLQVNPFHRGLTAAGRLRFVVRGVAALAGRAGGTSDAVACRDA